MKTERLETEVQQLADKAAQSNTLKPKDTAKATN